jgi:hypothetical protein
MKKMKNKNYSRWVVAGLYLFGSVSMQAQDFPDWRAVISISDSGYVELLQYFQIWNTLTLKSPKTESTPRFDTYIRRARFGLGGQINSKAAFYVGFFYDGIGQDSLTESAGIPNARDNTTFSIRDAFFTYKFSNYFNLTLGYFRPRAGKESIYTSAFNISQEKGQPNFQPRVHMVGRPIGRETGINIGGFIKGESLSFLYDVGIFDPNHPLIAGDYSIWSPLLTLRTVWMFGDPEFGAYQLVYSQSGFGKRKGLSVGINVAHQTKTSLFKNNLVYGIDAQLNYGALDLLGEYLWLYRESATANSYVATSDNSYVIKGAWNFIFAQSQILQLSVMHSATRPDKQFQESAFNSYTRASLHEDWAVGFNWLIKRNRLKLGLHYVEGKRYYSEISGNNKVGYFSFVNPSIQWMM